MSITQDQVRGLFDYRNGELYWKVSGKGRKTGVPAGCIRGGSYRSVTINSKRYKIHRLIFLYHHAYLPQFLDHIDGNPSNNDISNLREATNQENCMNRKKDKSNNGKPTSSIYKGVSWHKGAKKWQSQIVINGKHKYIGYFTSEIESAKAYNQAAIETFGEFAKLNDVT